MSTETRTPQPAVRPSVPTAYDPSDYPRFAVSVDVVALTIRAGTLHTLLITRAGAPFAGECALPGGFVRRGEDLPNAASRELSEETGLSQIPAHLEQLASYGTPNRDPRMRVVSVAYLALAPTLPDPVAGGDASGAQWMPTNRALDSELAFDHRVIHRDGVERARAKLEYTSLATAFCPAEFTIGQLRSVYEAVWDTRLDPRNFHRKVTKTPGLLVDTGRTETDGPGRPATVYRPGPVTVLNPPLTRDRLAS